MAAGKTATKCDDCEKVDCPERLKGSLCLLNKDVASLTGNLTSRDPMHAAKFIVSIIEKEVERYHKACEVEGIGDEVEKTITHKDGKEYTVSETKTIDNHVSNLALNIIKAGKMLNEILNPPKSGPMFQQNVQNNYIVKAADEIRSLGGADKDRMISFIDTKLDEARTH